MNFLVCCLCRRDPPLEWRGLCAGCVERSAELRASGDCSVRAGLFFYEGVIRDLIVQAKSRGDPCSFMGCWQLFSADIRTSDAVYWADVVAAVPPSFWTRIRGRPHLGSMLANQLARTYRKRWLQIDSRVFWRIRKQALKTGRQRRAPWTASKSGHDSNSASPFRVRLNKSLRRQPYRHVLIIDDVMTTGVTATAIARAVEEQFERHGGEVKVRVLSLAQSAKADFTDCISLPQTRESPSVQA
ncbi:MAG: hypothetical protein RIQ81_2003 [Pseudomonadota bacterium]|jgi:predicted amidophosphoribosyltransferase